MGKVDIDGLDRIFGPWKQYPVAFCEYPNINLLLDSIPSMIAELRTLRKLADAIKKAEEELYYDMLEVDDALAEYRRLVGDK